MIGEHTLGSAARQKLVKAARRQRDAALLSPVPRAWRDVIHEKGLQPEVLVDEPDVEFGTPAPDDGRDRCSAPFSTSARRKPRSRT